MAAEDRHGRVETVEKLPAGVYPAVRHVYRVKGIERVVDGDTYWLRADVGFRQTYLCEVRLLGYDTPETVGRPEYERKAAQNAKALATGFLNDAAAAYYDKPGDGLFMETFEDTDKYGRWLANVWVVRSGVVTSLGQVLEDAGFASVWPERWSERYPPP